MSTLGVVDVYRNLRTGGWSVRDPKTRLVVDHAVALVLHDVVFRVSVASRERARREGRRNVHAFARGTREAAQINANFDTSVDTCRRVTYRPLDGVGPWFEDSETAEPVRSAQAAIFLPHGRLFVTGGAS